MIEAVASVIRGEGVASAARRGTTRIAEGWRRRRTLMRGLSGQATLLNVSARPLSSRFGGVASQLMARLRHEAELRDVMVLSPGILERRGEHPGGRRVTPFRFTTALEDAAFEQAVLDCGARVIHLEGTAGIPLGSVLRLLDRGLRVIVSVHDFSLVCAGSNLLERSVGTFCDYSEDAVRCGRCLGEQFTRRALAGELLARAAATIFPSPFLRDRHRVLFGLEGGIVIEPGAEERPRRERRDRRARLAFAGSFQRHKGAHLLPDLARAGGEWHVFGGGDETLLRRARRHATIHGWYALGALPRLLERHAIDLVVLPSIVPESYGLTLSESRRAGIPAITFAHGALGERIASQGGGWLAPLEGGSDALISIIRRWRAGELTTQVPNETASPRTAAEGHVGVYRGLRIEEEHGTRNTERKTTKDERGT